jgi:hypothetical protein
LELEQLQKRNKTKRAVVETQQNKKSSCKNAAKQKVEGDWYANVYACKRKHKETKSTISATYKAQVDQIFVYKIIK